MGKKDKDSLLKKIIEEVRTAVGHLGQDMLSEILSKYGDIEDIDLIEELQTFNIDFETEEIDEEDSFKRKFIIIGDSKIVEVAVIKTIEKYDEYDFLNSTKKYKIIINEDPNGSLFCANTMVIYNNKEERDLDFSKVRKKLECFNIIFK